MQVANVAITGILHGKLENASTKSLKSLSLFSLKSYQNNLLCIFICYKNTSHNPILIQNYYSVNMAWPRKVNHYADNGTPTLFCYSNDWYFVNDADAMSIVHQIIL